MAKVNYEKAWQKLKEGMLESYANYEGQKRINKNMEFHKILEGAQISLASVLEDMDELDDIFTVEIEKEITEDTVIPKLLVKFKSPSRYQVFSNDYINGFEVEEGNIESFYILNDDLTMTLIWTKEKGLVD